MHQVKEAFDPLGSEVGVVLDSSDIISMGVCNLSMAETVRDRLLGNLGRAVGSSDLKFPSETRTPGEKLALQVSQR